MVSFLTKGSSTRLCKRASGTTEPNLLPQTLEHQPCGRISALAYRAKSEETALAHKDQRGAVDGAYGVCVFNLII